MVNFFINSEKSRFNIGKRKITKNKGLRGKREFYFGVNFKARNGQEDFRQFAVKNQYFFIIPEKKRRFFYFSRPIVLVFIHNQKAIS